MSASGAPRATGTLRIAAVQHDIVWMDQQANYERLAPMIASAAAAGAGLVLLTETFSTGFGFRGDGEAEMCAEDHGGASAQFLAACAAQHGLWVGGTCLEFAPDRARTDETRPANTFVLAGPDGTVHRYRKIHPFTHSGEERVVRPGDEFVTVEIDGVSVSLFVCYDLRFADEFWQVATETDVYLVPANWPERRRGHWIALLRARAIENQAYVVGVNRVGSGGGQDYSGDSCIIDPLGEELATAHRVETMVLAEVSAARVAEVRDRFRFLQDRREPFGR